MKVLHVIPSVSALQGGPSRAIVDIERALAMRGIEVTTVTTNDDGANRKLAVQCGTPIALTDATRWYFPRSSVFYTVSTGLGRWLRNNIESFDVVHSHGLFSFAPVMAATLARRARVPYVLRPFGVLATYGMTQRHPLLKRISFTLIERTLIEAASAVHFTSRLEQSEAETLKLRCRSVVIPLGIEVGAVVVRRRDDRRDRSERFNLLFLSRVDPKKNLEGVLKAVALLQSRHPNVFLDVGGDGDPDYVLKLRSLAKRLGVSDRVNWHGHVQGQTKTDMLASADAFVLPSHSENFGIAVVEALAAGLPCIVSDKVGVCEEIQTAAAGLIVDTNWETIAVAIDQLLTNEAKCATMSTAARQLALRRFSLATMGEQLEALYRDLRVTQPVRNAAFA